MFLKLNFKFRDLLIGIAIISPLAVLAIISYNPSERKAQTADEARRGTVNSLAKATDSYRDKLGTFPENITNLNSEGIIDWLPENTDQYTLKYSDNEFIIYTEAKSLAWREYCSSNQTNILYSSTNKRTDITCGENPQPGDQKFVN